PTSAAGLSRRGFLRASAASGGAFVLSFCLPARAAGAATRNAAAAGGTPPADFAPNAFVRIAADDRVTIVINKAEIGQGVSTSMAMGLADELDADWSKVAIEFAPVDAAYAHPGYGMQFTGGSTSTLAMTLPMREAGATARAMLIAAAAKRWGVPEAEC